MTSQKFSIFKPPPLSKVLVAPLQSAHSDINIGPARAHGNWLHEITIRALANQFSFTYLVSLKLWFLYFSFLFIILFFSPLDLNLNS